MNKKIIFALLALSLTTVFCASQPGGQVSPTPDINALVDATLTEMTFLSDTPIPLVPTGSTIPMVAATGSISGLLSYPSDFLPPLRVVAFSATNFSFYYYVDTTLNQHEYTITDLPAGVYHIVSYQIDSTILAGGYTQMVLCGLAYSCTDHSFIDVTVTAGETTPDINPGDWYADPGTFPPMPTP